MKASWSVISAGLRRENRWRFGSESITPYHLITGRAPRNTPRAFWVSIGKLKMLLRVTSLLLILCALVFFGGLVLKQTAAVGTVQRYAILPLVLVSVVHGCAGSFGLRIAYGRFKRFLTDHSWCVCLRCGYILEGLPSPHRCPECSLAYDRRQLEATWRAWISERIVYGADDRESSAGGAG